jgi:glycosyltransferase involved in cell wall biosynthesis
LLLLTFLRWVRETTDADVELVLWRAGPLVDAFADVADVTVLHPPPGRRSPAETVELGLGELGLRGLSRRLTAGRIGRALHPGPHDVVLLNGAGSALVLPHLRSAAPRVAHVHELERGLTFSLPGGRDDPFLTTPERLVAVSGRVADELTTGWGVDPARVVVQHGCLPVRVPGPATPPPGAGPPLVGSVGAGSWRKGVDLFTAMAAEVHRSLGDGVRFAWVGPLDDPAAVRADLDARGLADVVALPGEVGDPGPWLAAMAVFCSTAREDPFPLVGLEAGAAGVPVVAFDSGGLSELLGDGRGTVVVPTDAGAMAAAVIHALADPVPPDALRRHVLEHHTIEQMGPALWAELEAAATR